MNETQTTAPSIGACRELYPSRLDPHIPLGSWHFYQYESEQRWLGVNGEHLAQLLESRRPPRYRTVLSMSEADARGLDDGLSDVAYSGPFYIDIDVAPEFGGAAKAIEQMNKCLDKIEDAGVNLRTLRLYASGSKGFHIEMPMEVLLPKVPAGGIQKLPLIYKELVQAFYVDYVDMRVYTSRKGRMWRTPNVQRENGKYKVPVSLDEVRRMTPEVYAEVTSAPRAFPRLEPPAYVSTVGVLFSKAQDKVERLKPAKPDRQGALRQRFKGGLPPVVVGLCSGRIPIRQGVGWNRVAMQLAIVARECGMDADTLVAAAAPLMARHESDGRYNSNYARERELRSKVEYVSGSAGYNFSAQGLRSILPVGVRTPDLRGL